MDDGHGSFSSSIGVSAVRSAHRVKRAVYPAFGEIKKNVSEKDLIIYKTKFK